MDDDVEVTIMEHDPLPNGQDDEDDRNTPTESLAVIGRRAWEARQAAKAALQASLNTHALVEKLQREINRFPRVLVLIGALALLLLGAILTKVW